jgi:Dual specificity phosphatase, catalytic domain
VRRERAGAVWVGEKVKIPTLSQRTRQGWGNPGDSLILRHPLDAIAARRRTGVSALQKTTLRKTTDKVGMDITWLTDRIAVGGGIWNASNMASVAKAGVTHIINMQIEFDDTPLAREHGIRVLWNPTDDDFEPKPPVLFERGVDFARAALAVDETKLFIHCAAGVHRGPIMALAVLGSMGWDLNEAMALIEGKRPVADFAEVYVGSVERFLDGRNS